MIHVIDSAAAASHRPLLDTMFADRKRLFVDLFGWDVPIIDGRFEVDQFDTAATVYLVVASLEGQHEASMRLMPTTQPHMLAELFGHLCPAGVPVGGSIWESSRLCLPQRHGAERRRVLRDALISAMVDFALERGITGYTGILPDAFRKEVISMGWRAEPLGPAIRIPGGPIGAFLAHIEPDTPERLRWTGVYVSAGGRVTA